MYDKDDEDSMVNLPKSELIQLFLDDLESIKTGDGLEHLHNEDDTISRYETLRDMCKDCEETLELDNSLNSLEEEARKRMKDKVGNYFVKDGHIYLLIAFCEQPSITFQRVDNKEKESMAVGSLNASKFKELVVK